MYTAAIEEALATTSAGRTDHSAIRAQISKYIDQMKQRVKCEETSQAYIYKMEQTELPEELPKTPHVDGKLNDWMDHFCARLWDRIRARISIHWLRVDLYSPYLVD